MRRLALLAAALALSGAALAQPTIAVFAYNNQGKGSSLKIMEGSARGHYERHAGGDKRLLEMSSEADLLRLFEELDARGIRLSKLMVFSHGEAGAMNGLESAEPFRGRNAPFAPGAEVVIWSCEVGGGLIGARFLKSLGDLWLAERGGSIVAPTSLFWGFSSGIHFSPAGYQRYTVEAGGRDGTFSQSLELGGTRERLLADLAFMESRIASEFSVPDARRREFAALAEAARAAMAGTPGLDEMTRAAKLADEAGKLWSAAMPPER